MLADKKKNNGSLSLVPGASASASPDEWISWSWPAFAAGAIVGATAGITAAAFEATLHIVEKASGN